MKILLVVAVMFLGSLGFYQESFAASLDDKNEIQIDQSVTRPTFGLSHENEKKIVTNGFTFNNQTFTITNNFHTPFEELPVNLGEINTFETKVYAEKDLRIQEFLFGIPQKGDAHLAELGIEVWYGIFGEIDDIKVIQKSHVIDMESITATHQKTKCQASDKEEKCDTTNISMIFLEPLQDKVMAVKAIDFKKRYQITYLNEGLDISGKSLNPMATKMIPSNVKYEGLILVTQTAKYSPYWITEDQRIFEENYFGSFKQINQSFERFQDTGNAFTRMHSGFDGIIAYEQNRAQEVFDSSKLISELPETFETPFTGHGDRINQEMKERMLEQEKISQKYLEISNNQARW